MIIKNGGEQMSTDRIVLFPFDDFSLPFQNGVRLHLVPYETPVDRTRIVVPQGPAGAPDSRRIFNVGGVHRVGDELWLWYHGQGEEALHRVCFATSRDGYTWQKPNLGLVQYNGSTDNNVVQLPGGENDSVFCGVVFHEPDDPDPARRFKAVLAINKRLTAVVSSDGVRWREIDSRPELPACEVSGGTRFNGCYYLSGHGGSHFGAARQLVMAVSNDFEHWMEATCLGMRRENIPPRPMAYGFNEGEQVHGGAALWNRGNVIIGLYGQWHGPRNNDRRHVDMDLGLVVSNDALHYKEPIPDFRMVAAAEDGFRHLPELPMLFKYSGLVQGQGFENVGEETLFWYTPWPEQVSDGVRVASWKRDRLGYFQAFPARHLRSPQACHVISAPIDLEGQRGRVSLNVDGLSESAQMSVEILDQTYRPVAGYARADCLPLDSGLQQQVAWKTHELVEQIDEPFRIRLNFAGLRPEDPKLYAVNVEHAG